MQDQAFVLAAKVGVGHESPVPIPCNALRIVNHQWNEDVSLPYRLNPVPADVSMRSVTKIRVNENVLAEIRRVREDHNVEAINTELGTYHPYMQRSSWVVGHSPCRDLLLYPGAVETLDDLKTVLESLSDRLLEIFAVVQPDHANMHAFGYEIRALLFLACSEVENQMKQVLIANGYCNISSQGSGSSSAPPIDADRLTTKDYVKLLEPMKLSEFEVTLTRYKTQPFIPFKDWNAKSPSQSLSWYDAYNAAKHNRLENANRATLSSVINAVAAVFVLAKAKFGSLVFEGTNVSRLMEVNNVSFPIGELYFALKSAESGFPLPLSPKEYDFIRV